MKLIFSFLISTFFFTNLVSAQKLICEMLEFSEYDHAVVFQAFDGSTPDAFLYRISRLPGMVSIRDGRYDGESVIWEEDYFSYDSLATVDMTSKGRKSKERKSDEKKSGKKKTRVLTADIDFPFSPHDERPLEGFLNFSDTSQSKEFEVICCLDAAPGFANGQHTCSGETDIYLDSGQPRRGAGRGSRHGSAHDRRRVLGPGSPPPRYNDYINCDYDDADYDSRKDTHFYDCGRQ